MGSCAGSDRWLETRTRWKRLLKSLETDDGQRESVVADIMGHESNVGITFGLCSNAQLKQLKKDCVESVTLPL